ncbi:MAG: rRNA pseudouridine synthase [Holosporaceae bacterium]|jgi:23S rRNA pseudouridine2605 synthase|nr:rRNA pseudouridine synthase [Holosporaceae bacterium]
MSQTSDKNIRLAKRIAESGVASRREAERLIESGRVSVDNEIVTTPVFFVGEDNVIRVDGKSIPCRSAEILLWKFYKPRGVITTRKDPQQRSTVFDLFGQKSGRILSIGRLDYNSEGLLLFTNNGATARKMELPSTGLTRIYRARIYGKLSANAIQELKNGVVVESVSYGSIDVVCEYNYSRSSNGWVTVTIREGKNREIRKVMEHFCCRVNRLVRIAYGPFHLEDLSVGQWQLAKDSEMKALKRLIPN